MADSSKFTRQTLDTQESDQEMMHQNSHKDQKENIAIMAAIGTTTNYCSSD